ncbi:hypothetical protein Ae201684_007549 [Aphanomyces euteiches]|uniref:Uncharacterized protein n=1 Tax=Aphanomyces euteiches TaxID=100861 RepID=A0A6G0X957_9STRA|nr:hypothetical protein Ae201684_007549 [Aphanomyces euteiches]KAH9141368.1 hypothetical protein AeRB84_014451 [Aphanomyces euteiches]
MAMQFLWGLLIMCMTTESASNVVYYRQGNNIVARYDDYTAKTILDSRSWTKILGMTVHEQSSKLYWSDSNAIWRSNLDGSNQEVFLGAYINVTWSGVNFGDNANDVNLTVLSYPCTSITAWTPTSVSCLMRFPSKTQSNVTSSDLTLQTPYGIAPGVTQDFNEQYSTKAYTKPLVKAVSIDVKWLHPHTIAVDKFDVQAHWLYFSDYVHGAVYRADTTTFDFQVVVSNEWSVHGLSVFGSSLRYSVESQGIIYLLNVSNLNARPVPILQSLKSPRGLCVDRTNTTIYFVGKSGKIFKARGNGEFFYTSLRDSVQVQRILALGTATRLNSIALDETNRMLYWSETNTNVISRASLDTMQRQVVTGNLPQSILSWPRHVHVTQGGKLYFSEYGGRISAGDITANGPFNYVVNQPTDTILRTNLPGQNFHFYALE